MFTLLHPDEHAWVAPLFGPGYPNLAFVHAVLERRIPGEVWACMPSLHPSACLVTTQAPYCFLAGDVGPALLDHAVTLLQRRPSLILVYPPGSGVGSGPLPPGLAHSRREQWVSEGLSDDLGQPLPDGHQLVPIDARRYEQSNWPAVVGGIFGGAERYVRHAHGYGIVHDGALVAEAHSVNGGGYGELGTYTAPHSRRRGLSFATIAAVAHESERRGIRTTATFAETSHASRCMARRLGLKQESTYGAIVRPSPPASAGGREAPRPPRALAAR